MKKAIGTIITLLTSSLAWGQLEVAQPETSPYFMMESQRQSVVVNGHHATPASQTRRFTAHLTFAHFDDLERHYGSYDLKACTGVLVHPRVIATSAHCLEHYNVTKRRGEVYRYNSVKVSFGFSEKDPDYYQAVSTDIVMFPAYFSYDEETSKEIYQNPYGAKTVDSPVEIDGDGKIRVKLNPDWEYYRKVKNGRANSNRLFNRPFANMNLMHRSGIDDFALIFLKEPVPEPFKPVKIFDDHQALTNKHSLWIAGFGVDHFDTEQQTLNSPRLRFSEYVLEGIFTEPNSTPSALPRLRGVFSFPKDDKYVCNGDSGGPSLVYVGEELKLLSVSSSNEFGCVGFHYGTVVAPFTHWIEEEMAARGLFDLNI